MVGRFTLLGDYWTRIETKDERANITFLRIDRHTLQHDGHTYREALAFVQENLETGALVANHPDLPGAGHRVLAVRADEDRQVIRIKARWIPSAQKGTQPGS